MCDLAIFLLRGTDVPLRLLWGDHSHSVAVLLLTRLNNNKTRQQGTTWRKRALGGWSKTSLSHLGMSSQRHIVPLYACCFPSRPSPLSYRSTFHFDPFHPIWSHLHGEVPLFSRRFHVPTFLWGRPFWAQFFVRAKIPLCGCTLINARCALPKFLLPLHVLVCFVSPTLRLSALGRVSSSRGKFYTSCGRIGWLHCPITVDPWCTPTCALESPPIWSKVVFCIRWEA